MANRRMFSQKITSSARFLKMPVDSQTLYFHLGMNADDDGVVEAWSVLKSTGSPEDNLRVLVSKGFIKPLNDDLVSYILDWSEHNRIRPDRLQPSFYRELLMQILPDVQLVTPRTRTDLLPAGRPVDNQWTAQVRLGKDSKDTAKADFQIKETRENSEGEEIPLKVKVQNSSIREYEELCSWAEKRRGFPFVRRAKQYASLKLAKEMKKSKTRLKERWIKQEGEAWREGKVDWVSVVSSFDKEA